MEWDDDGPGTPVPVAPIVWSLRTRFFWGWFVPRVLVYTLISFMSLLLFTQAAALYSAHPNDWPDLVNAGFEVLAVAAIVASIRKLRKDKSVLGIHASHVLYSVASATWFIFYYGHLDQMFSLACALGYWIAVVTWAGMMIAYGCRDLLGFGKGEL